MITQSGVQYIYTVYMLLSALCNVFECSSIRIFCHKIIVIYLFNSPACKTIINSEYQTSTNIAPIFDPFFVSLDFSLTHFLTALKKCSRKPSGKGVFLVYNKMARTQ